MILFLQGSYLPEEEAKISVFDRGFLYGDSVYETLRVVGRRAVFFDEHWKRLCNSAAGLGIETDPPPYDLAHVIDELIDRNQLHEAQVRVIVTRGVGGRDQWTGMTPTWYVGIEPFVPMSEEKHRAGVAAVLVSVVRHGVGCQNPEIKSSNLLNNLLARREAVQQGAFEGIMTNPERLLAEGAHTNLFWVVGDDSLCTPDLSVGILPGVTRQKVIECAREAGFEVAQVRESATVLEEATEIFLTSTTLEILAVTQWNRRMVGEGVEGAITRKLRLALQSLYRSQEELR